LFRINLVVNFPDITIYFDNVLVNINEELLK
jgi:hypothetical protein